MTTSSWIDTIWTDIKADVTKDLTYVENAVESVFNAEVATLKPIIEEELTAFSASVAANPSIEGIVAAGATLWANLAAKVPGAALSTGITTFISSITAGMSAAVTAATTPVATESATS